MAPRDPDAPDDDDEAPDDDVDEVEGDDPARPRLDAAVVQRFVGSKDARRIANDVIRRLVPRSEVEDLVGETLERALVARPPATEVVLPAWLMTIARRRAARWLEKRKRRKKYEGEMPDRAVAVDDYTGEPTDERGAGDESEQAVEEDDEDAAELLGEYLDRLVANHPRDREIRDVLREHAEEKKPYNVIAAERGLSEAQLANRIYRFKLKYGPRVKQRRRQMFLLKLFAGLAAAALAIALAWWLSHRREDIRPDPSPPPVPSASASAPEPEPFMPAQPTDTAPEQPEKPPRPKP